MRVVASFLFVASLAVLGCSSSDFSVAGGDGGTDGSGDDTSIDDGGTCTGTSCPCADPTFRCGTKCVDRSTDPNHCGACADKCPVPPGGTATCKLGICGIGCATGTHACGVDCVSDTSPNSCGTSCSPCPGGTNASPACTGGKCALACHTGFADCDGKVDTGCETSLNSNSSCGSCGKACSTGTFCGPDGSGGFTCGTSCTPPSVLCPGIGACVDITKDPSHCGGCGSPCPADPHGEPTCGGTPPACGVKCDDGYHACGGVCVSDSDATKCGTSCTPCAGGAHASPVCDPTSGTCKLACDPGFADCDGIASTGCEADLNNDPANCSRCGEACIAPAGGSAVCSGGSCSFTCQPGWAQLHGVGCAVFGGAYEQNLASAGGLCPLCPQPDPLGGTGVGCGCPSAFSTETMPLAIASSCSTSPGSTSPVTFCFVPPPATLPPTSTPPDWSGAFLLGDACGAPCQVPNPYTKDCSCPGGTTTMTVDTSFYSTCSPTGTPLPGKLGICAGPGPGVTFFGAFAQNNKGDCVAGTMPISGGSCSCPPGTGTALKYPMIVSGGQGTLVICYP